MTKNATGRLGVDISDDVQARAHFESVDVDRTHRVEVSYVFDPTPEPTLPATHDQIMSPDFSRPPELRELAARALAAKSKRAEVSDDEWIEAHANGARDITD